MAKPPGKSFNTILIALRSRTRRPPDEARRERSLNSILIALSAGGVALVLLRGVNYGIGLGSDSREYVAAARGWLEGNGFTAWNGEPIAHIAPFFPAVLAFFGLLGMKVITVGAFLNAIAFGATILTTTVWLKIYVKSRFLIIWTGCAIALWVPLANLSAILMTDTLFIALTVFSLYTLDRFITTTHQPMMIISAVCASLAWLTRYQGVAVVATALLLILARKGLTFKRKAKESVIYTAVASTPMVVWIIRNLIATNTLAGSREGHLQYQDPLIVDSITSELVYWTFGNTVSGYVNRLAEVLFGTVETGISVLVVIYRTVILLAMAAGIGYALMRLRRRYRWDNPTALAVPAIFTAVYAVSIAAPPIINYEGIYVRYLLPLYIPALVIIVMTMDKLHEQISLPRYMPMAATAILSLWLVQTIPENYTNISNRIEDGFGAASKTWAKSETIRHLRYNPLKGRIYTTSHWVIYFSDVCTDDCRPIPIQNLWDQTGRFIGPDLAGEPFYIVVLQHDDYYNLLVELSESATLEIISIHLDGLILKPTADGADIEQDKVLTRDVIVDMIMLNPDRFDGRSVLERFSLAR